jgi:hypothetical protein
MNPLRARNADGLVIDYVEDASVDASSNEVINPFTDPAAGRD